VRDVENDDQGRTFRNCSRRLEADASDPHVEQLDFERAGGTAGILEAGLSMAIPQRKARRPPREQLGSRAVILYDSGDNLGRQKVCTGHEIAIARRLARTHASRPVRAHGADRLGFSELLVA